MPVESGRVLRFFLRNRGNAYLVDLVVEAHRQRMSQGMTSHPIAEIEKPVVAE